MYFRQSIVQYNLFNLGIDKYGLKQHFGPHKTFNQREQILSNRRMISRSITRFFQNRINNDFYYENLVYYTVPFLSENLK